MLIGSDLPHTLCAVFVKILLTRFKDALMSCIVNEQMERRSAGGGGKTRRKTGGKPDEEGMLSQFGLGRGHWKNTTCCVCFFVITTAMVTAWMQTCVPFCGAKVILALTF